MATIQPTVTLGEIFDIIEKWPGSIGPTAHWRVGHRAFDAIIRAPWAHGDVLKPPTMATKSRPELLGIPLVVDDNLDLDVLTLSTQREAA